MSVENLSQSSVEDLHKELVDLKKQLFNLRLKKSTGQLVDTSVFRKTKKNIARVYTFIKLKSDNRV